MNSNHHKYLKYKKKYINIKNETYKLIQKSDTPISLNIFTLYTTGLGNWLNDHLLNLYLEKIIKI